MADPFRQLLEATIQHLEDLRDHGTRFVALAPESLTALGSRPRQRRSPAPTQAASPPATPASRIGKVSGEPPNRAVTAAPPPSDAPSTAAPEMVATRKPLNREEKEVAMAALRERALVCRRCEHLAAARKNVVFGVGDIHSPLMFVGEAPGADEDVRGEPFVGAAGQLLTKIILATGLSRSTVYIANILKCRPDTPGQTAGNRKPSPAEMTTCLPYLLEQIDIIQPRVLVALGATAIEGLLGKTEGITRLRGQWRVFRGIPLMPTYHPAFLLRNQALSVKRQVWEDMLKVMEKLEMPISEKQRNYFLKP